MTKPGVLIAVVGPSGAGKDTVIDGARALLAGDSRFVFPRRIVTRPAEAGGEAHVPVSVDAFAAMKADGAFALDWDAHGVSYGIPAAIADDLAAGRAVVVNLSRPVAEAARGLFPRMVVVEVTAPPHILAQRLARRGREDAQSIRERLERSSTVQAHADEIVTNDTSPDAAIAAFMGILRRHASPL